MPSLILQARFPVNLISPLSLFAEIYQESALRTSSGRAIVRGKYL